MSPAQIPALDIGENTGGTARAVAGERRRFRRYPLQIVLYHREAAQAGQPGVRGETCDISNRAVRFATAAPPRPGSMLELAMRWPLRLGNDLPLRLIVTGPVLRVDSRGSVMLIKTFRFARVAEGETADATEEVNLAAGRTHESR